MAPHLVFRFNSPDEAENMLTTWRHRLENIFDERPLFFHALTDFHYGQLKEEIIEKIKGPHGPTIGQHCGRSLKPDSQTKA